MSDRLKDLPDLIFKKIYRYSDIETQSNLYRAYDNEKDQKVLEIIKGQKAQLISCWLCQIPIYLEYFFLNDGNHRHCKPMSNFLKLEPKRGTVGFDLLYKFIAESPVYGQVFRQRNMKDPAEMTEPDRLFIEFQKELASVPSFDNYDDLVQHQKQIHTDQNFTGIDGGFWDEFESLKREFI